MSAAEKTLLRLRGHNYPALEEVKEITRCSFKENSDLTFLGKLKQMAVDGAVRKPMILLSCMFVLQVRKNNKCVVFYV